MRILVEPWHIIQRLGRIGRSMRDLFLPRQCAGCRDAWLSSEHGFWCQACLDGLPWITSPLCLKCGRPFPKSPSAPDHLCGDCLQSAFMFTGARSTAEYAGVIRQRIHQFKFGNQLHWAPSLAQLLAIQLERDPLPKVDIILPVPLHVRRLRQRGFNQAGLLARALAKKLCLPVDFGTLVRKYWTEPQTRLSRDQRLRNVKDAFAVARANRVAGRRVMIIDDVFTTGTTLNECAKTLFEAGAAEVHARTVGRALPDAKMNYADGSD